MAGPWEKYNTNPVEETPSGPWAKYGAAPTEEPFDYPERPHTVAPPENMRDDRGVPGGPTYVPPAEAPVGEDLSMGMYDNMSPEQAQGKYEEIQNRGQKPLPALDESIPFEEAGRRIAQTQVENQRTESENTSILGEPIVNGQVVNRPEVDVNSVGKAGAGVGPVQMVTNAARSSAKNAIMSAAAAIDEISGSKGLDTTLLEMANKAIADRPRGGANHPLQEVTMQAAEIASGAIAGYKVGNKTGSVMTGGNYSPRAAANYFAKALASFGSMVGIAATEDVNTQPITAGPQAMLPGTFEGTIFEGVPVNPNGTFNEQFMAKKTNLVIDEFSSAFVGQKVAQAVAAAGTVAKHVFYDQVKPLWSEGTREVEAVQSLINGLNLPDTDASINAVRQAINDNMDVWMKVAGEDAMPMNRTTMSAINEGMKESNPMAAKQAMEIESAMSAGAHPNLTARQELPENEFEKFQNAMSAKKGGIDTVEHTTRTLQDQGFQEIGNAKASIPLQETNVRQAEETVRNDLRNNPFLGPDIRANEASSRLDVNRTKSQAEDRVMSSMDEAASSMHKIKDEKYASIPKDAPADIESFNKVLNDNIDYVPKNILARVTNPKNPLTFQELYNEVQPQISKLLSRERKAVAPDPARLEALEAIYDNIHDTQVEYVATHGSADAKAAALEARRYFRDDYVPLAKAPVVGPLFDGRVNKYKAANNQQLAANSLSDNQKGTNQAVVDLIKRPEYKGDKKDLVRVAMGEKAADLARQGIDTITSKDLMSGLDKAGVSIKDNFPEEAALYEKLANRLDAAKGNVEVEKQVLAEVKKIAAEAEKRVTDGALKPFLEDLGGDLKPKEGGYQVFKKLFNSQDSGNKLNELVERVQKSGDPMAQKGLESAYFTYLKDRISEGSLGFSNKQATRLTNDPELDNLRKYGEKIFGTSGEVEDYSKVVKSMQNEKDKRVPDGLRLNSKGGLLKDRAANATRMGITMALGVLNPTATKVRTVANILIGGAGADAKALKIMDFLASDKKYALELLDKYANFKNNSFGDEAKSVLWKMAVASGAYTDKDRKDFDNQFAEEKKKPVEKETDEILSKKK